MPPRPKDRGPRPGLGTIATAISGGLAMPMLDPSGEFRRQIALSARSIDRLDMEFNSFKEPLTTSLNKVIVPSVVANFAAQGRPRWKGLTPKTVQSRLSQGYPRGPILQRSGKLKREATRKNIWVVRYNELKFMSTYFDQKMPYGKYHQFGARNRKAKSGSPTLSTSMTGTGGFSKFKQGRVHSVEIGAAMHTLPPRPFIKLDIDEEAEIANIFMSFMVDKVNKYWGQGTVNL